MKANITTLQGAIKMMQGLELNLQRAEKRKCMHIHGTCTDTNKEPHYTWKLLPRQASKHYAQAHKGHLKSRNSQNARPHRASML